MDEPVAAISHVIQLAVAPVFLLTGIAGLMSVMTQRLGRVIDRARYIEERMAAIPPERLEHVHRELAGLRTRSRLASWAINFCTVAALLICIVIGTLFVEAFIDVHLRWLVGGLFLVTMIMLVLGLVMFLREVYVATHTVVTGPPGSKS